MLEIKIKLPGRIDKVLVRELREQSLSRNYIQKLISLNLILVNDKIIKNNYILKKDDIVKIKLPEKKILDIKPENIKFKIIYEDKDIVVIDKPNDLVVHPSNGHENGTLVNGILKKIKTLSDINGIIRPGIVHRIDRFTTGLLVIAKNNNSHKFLSECLKNKVIKRYYYALVHGNFDHNIGDINAPIGRDSNNRKKMVVTNKNSKDAITKFKIIESFNNFTLLECEILTGRTHQIRAHLEYIKHPIYGDNIYGHLSDKNNPFGQFLHAYMLELVHPITKKKMVFKSKLPKKFNEKIRDLRKEMNQIEK